MFGLKEKYLLRYFVFLISFLFVSCSIIRTSKEGVIQQEDFQKPSTFISVKNENDKKYEDKNSTKNLSKIHEKSIEISFPKLNGISWEIEHINLPNEEYYGEISGDVEDVPDYEPDSEEIQEIEEIFQKALTSTFPKEIKKFERYFIKGFGSFNIPVELNDYVEYFIYLFTETKYREYLEKWIRRYFKYSDFMRRIILSYGLPDDLVFVAMAESGFSTRAVSHMDAVGPWQFIEETARRYNLKIDQWIDERRDIEKSTHAAMRYLKDLYDMFGDWYLAWAAYNAGEKRIENAIKKAKGNKDYWYLLKRNLIPRETQGYVPKIIALALIIKNLDKFGFSLSDMSEEDTTFSFDEIKSFQPVDIFTIAKICGCSPEDILELNPSLRYPVTPPYDYTIRVPRGKGKIVREKLDFINQNFFTKFYPNLRYVSFSPSATGDYSVKTVLGWIYLIPKSSDSSSIRSIVYNMSDGDMVGEVAMEDGFFALPIFGYVRPYKIYRVKRRESISSIARKFGISPSYLRKFNGGIRYVRAGQRIKIPVIDNRYYMTSEKKPFIRYSANIDSRAMTKNSWINSYPNTYLGDGKKYIHHIVKKGENLYTISKKYGVSVSDIKKVNKIEGKVIYPGQKLIIPVKM